MSSSISKKCENVLSTAGLRRTKPRMAVLSALFRETKPVTQQQIAEQLSEDAPDKVTIYRTLETLIDADIVHRAFVKQRCWYFELAHNCTRNQCHPHFTCTGCGSTFCLTQLNMPMARSPYKGFLFTHQQVRLQGFCPDCANK